MPRKPLKEYPANGWTITRRPNTFAERWAYEATAVDSAGYLTARHGFGTLKAAKAFCRANPTPDRAEAEFRVKAYLAGLRARDIAEGIE